MTDLATETNKTGGDSDPFEVCRKTSDFRDHSLDREERGNAQLYRSGAMGRKPQNKIPPGFCCSPFYAKTPRRLRGERSAYIIILLVLNPIGLWLTYETANRRENVT